MERTRTTAASATLRTWSVQHVSTAMSTPILTCGRLVAVPLSLPTLAPTPITRRALQQVGVRFLIVLNQLSLVSQLSPRLHVYRSLPLPGRVWRPRLLEGHDAGPVSAPQQCHLPGDILVRKTCHWPLQVFNPPLRTAWLSMRWCSVRYHMYGTGIGQLEVLVKSLSRTTRVWSMSGDQGNRWKQAKVPIGHIDHTFQVWLSYIAITT